MKVPKIRVITEQVDDYKLIKDIEKLEKQLADKKQELYTVRKNAVLKYKSEMLNGELLLNSYCNSCYVYDAANDDLVLASDKILT